MRNLPRSEWECLIDEWVVGRNAERDRKILKRRFLDGVGFERLAEEFDLSTRHTKSIVYKYSTILLYHIDKQKFM